MKEELPRSKSDLIFSLFWVAIFCFFLSSSVIKTTIRPDRFLPVRPNRWTIRVGDPTASNDIIKSTDPISKPSSPILVHTRTFSLPSRNSCITRCCSFCVIPFPFSLLVVVVVVPLSDDFAPFFFLPLFFLLPVAEVEDPACPTNPLGFTNGFKCSSSSIILSTLERHSVNIIAFVSLPRTFGCCSPPRDCTSLASLKSLWNRNPFTISRL